ncbi:expressed unknown protein [Seminavis robusta]|uniref:Uncharacterized protein n=1 Tax=Seminavis robusta TaxID=568900 RepID=A0A9N8EZ85_9STRA|nr:expressed unknown protein [Seminavis robusta]|eukprot:Sro2383_g325660.1 n/a (131) ;mRNA; r:12556-12948
MGNWISSALLGGTFSVAGVHLGLCDNRNFVSRSVDKVPLRLYLSIFGMGSVAYIVNCTTVRVLERRRGRSRSILSAIFDRYTYMTLLVKPVPFALVSFSLGYAAACYSPRWVLESVLSAFARDIVGKKRK